MSHSDQESSSVEEYQPETLAEYLKRQKEKFLLRTKAVKEDPEERSESPVRDHPPPVRQPRYVPPKARTAGIPKGFARSTCELGHTCKNALCYTHTSIPGCVWDRKKFPKPYVPINNHNNLKKFEVYTAVQELQDLEREKEARRQLKALKKQK